MYVIYLSLTFSVHRLVHNNKNYYYSINFRIITYAIEYYDNDDIDDNYCHIMT